jgi:hypothetical protein
VLVGAGAHVAATGIDHGPGGAHATELLLGLAVALGLALAGAFTAGVFGTLPPAIATKGRRRYGALQLALAGTLAYILIELAEGHALGSAALLRALAASLPLAALVLTIARRGAAAAAGAGARFAQGAAGAQALLPSFDGRASRRHGPAPRRPDLSPERGRAPPLFA